MESPAARYRRTPQDTAGPDTTFLVHLHDRDLVAPAEMHTLTLHYAS